MTKNVVIDIETSGLDEKFHNMIEIAVIPYDHRYRPLEGIKFTSRIKPVDTYAMDPKAMEINNITLDELDRAPTSAQVRSMFLEWKEEIFGDEKLLPLGHNYAGFDKLFLRRWLGDFYNKIFSHHSRDSMIIVDFCREVGIIDIESTSLASCVKYFKINTQELHMAYFDAICSLEIYKKCRDMVKKLVG